MEKGFEKIILQFTTDFENTLFFKGGWGGSDAIKHPHRKNTLLPREKLSDLASASASQMHWINCHAIATQPMFQNHK